MTRMHLLGLALACSAILTSHEARSQEAPAVPRGRGSAGALPEAATGRLGTNLWRQGGPIECLAVSPDGRTIASSGGSWGVVRLWDLPTGTEIGTLVPDSKPTLTGPTLAGSAAAVAFSPDGRLLAAGYDAIVLYDLATRKQVLRAGQRAVGVTALSFTPDGKTVVSGNEEGDLQMWDASTGKELQRLAGHSQEVFSVAVSPKGALLASAANDGTIRLWDVAKRREERRTELSRTWNAGWATFSPDGSLLASAGHDSLVRLWDVATGKELKQLHGLRKIGKSVAFSPGGETLASCAGPSVALWDVKTGKHLRTLTVPTADLLDSIARVCFTPDGTKVVSGGLDGVIRIWGVADGQELNQQPGHQAPITGLALLPGGRTVVTAGRDGAVRGWDSTSGKQAWAYQRHDGREVLCVGSAPAGKVVASGHKDRKVRFLDSATGKELGELDVGEANVTALCFSPDSKLLATGGWFGVVRVIDAETKGEILQFQAGKSQAVSVGFSPDGRHLVARMRDDSIYVWDLAERKERFRFKGESMHYSNAAFSPDGKVLCLENERRVCLLDAMTGRILRRFPQNEGGTPWLTWLAFSPDGKLIASGRMDGIVQLWDVASGKRVGHAHGHKGGVTALAFSKDGKRLFSSGMDTSVLIWDVARLGVGGK